MSRMECSRNILRTLGSYLISGTNTSRWQHSTLFPLHSFFSFVISLHLFLLAVGFKVGVAKTHPLAPIHSPAAHHFDWHSTPLMVDGCVACLQQTAVDQWLMECISTRKFRVWFCIEKEARPHILNITHTSCVPDVDHIRSIILGILFFQPVSETEGLVEVQHPADLGSDGWWTVICYRPCGLASHRWAK